MDKKLKKAVMALAVLSICCGIGVEQVYALGEQGSVLCRPNSSGGNNSSSGDVDVSGDWTQEGTDTYKVAKEIFDTLTSMGFSGAGASGAVGNAYAESGFNPKAINESGGVAGIFQWSGWSNTINGTRITGEGSIKRGDESTLTLENELKLMKYELNGPYKTVKSMVGLATSASDGALAWQKYYEGASGQGDEKRKKSAETAYLLFKASDIAGDSGLLGDTTDTAISGGSNSSNSKSCRSPAGSGINAEIGQQGTINGKHGKVLKTLGSWGEVPSEYKKYIKVPEFNYSLADSPFTGDLQGQCTELTWGYMMQLYGKAETMGDGGYVWESYKKSGAEITGIPTVGYGFSALSGYAGASGSAGHTGIVVGVLDNGQYITANFNWGIKPDGTYDASRKAPNRFVTYALIDGADGTTDNIKFFSGLGDAKTDK